MPELDNGKLILAFPTEATKSGKPQMHDMTYLLTRLTPREAMNLAQKVEEYCSAYTSPLRTASLVSRALALWPEAFVMFPTDSTLLFQAVKELRANWYRRADPRLSNHVSLATANKDWEQVIAFMKYLSRNGLPMINYGALGANADWNACNLKQTAKTVTDLERVNVIRGQSADADYNGALIAPLSIHLSDEDYLDQYERDLQEAMDAIYKAAVDDLDAFTQMEEVGRELLDKIRPKYKEILERAATHSRNSDRYVDPAHGLVSIFAPAHPDWFAYKLAMVDVEMGGIPQPSSYSEFDPSRSTPGNRVYKRVQNGPSRWHYLGKGTARCDYHELLGHLGVMSIEAMVACLAIIHIENPSINVMSLQRAELEDADGHSILLVGAGEGDAQRLIVNKPRAETQKSVILEGKSLEAMQCILRWTTKCRQALKDARDPNANKLLLYVNRNNSVSFAGNNDIGRAFSLRVSGGFKYVPFVERHPELSIWAPRINMAALRVSAGVLAWFKSGGDEDAARRAFGHATSSTSLRHYIPWQIQEKMNVRKIRRFQNLLICAACAGEDYLLQATDFLTLAELHDFLSQMLTGNGMAAGNDLLEAIRKAHGFKVDPAPAESSPVAPVSLEDQETVYLTLSVNGLAMLRLYRDRLLAPDISAQMLDTPDPRTGTKPRLWLDLGNAFEQHDESIAARYPEYRAIIEQAAKRAEELRDTVRFPDFKVA